MTGRALGLALLVAGCQRSVPAPAEANPESSTLSACAAALPTIASQPVQARLLAMGKACAWSSAEVDLATQAQAAPTDLAGIAELLSSVPLEEACPGTTRLLSTLGPDVDPRPAFIERCKLTGVKATTPAANMLAAGVLAHALRKQGVADPLTALAEPLGLQR